MKILFLIIGFALGFFLGGYVIFTGLIEMKAKTEELIPVVWIEQQIKQLKATFDYNCICDLTPTFRMYEIVLSDWKEAQND